MNACSIGACVFALVACTDPVPAEWEGELEQWQGARLSTQTTELAGFYAHQEEYGHRLWAGADRPICLLDPDQAMVQIADEADRYAGGAGRHLIARGRLSQRGDFGHLNTCSHIFAVSEVVEYRSLTPAESIELRRVWPLECTPGQTRNVEAYRCE